NAKRSGAHQAEPNKRLSKIAHAGQQSAPEDRRKRTLGENLHVLTQGTDASTTLHPISARRQGKAATIIVSKPALFPASESSHRQERGAGRAYPNCRCSGCDLRDRLKTPEGRDKADLANPPGFVACPRPDRRQREWVLT